MIQKAKIAIRVTQDIKDKIIKYSGEKYSDFCRHAIKKHIQECENEKKALKQKNTDKPSVLPENGEGERL